jgi:hypothetical protein
VLVTAPIDQVATAVAGLGFEALLLPAGPDRTAVIPREGDGGYADAYGLAEQIAAVHGFAALSQSLVDSDVLIMHAHRSGEPVHRYVSQPAMLAQAFEESDGTFSFHLDGVTYAAGQPIPSDPIGADPTVLAPFSTGQVDLDRLGAALRGHRDRLDTDHDADHDADHDESGPPVFAEDQHEEILAALNLDPRGLTIAFRWAVSADLPGAVHVGTDHHQHTGLDCWSLPVEVAVALPLAADPADGAQILADALIGRQMPMRADVGYTPVVPGAAADPRMIHSLLQLGHGQQVATYFIDVQIHAATPPDRRQVIAEIDAAWANAWREHYGLTGKQEPVFAPTTTDRFEIGYAAAHTHRSSRPPT